MSEFGPGLFKKSALPLLIILVILAGGIFAAASLIESTRISTTIRKEKPLAILFIFELHGKPAVNELFLWFPDKRKAAMMDVPGSMGIILKSMKQMNAVDTVYDPRQPARFVKEIGAYLGIDILGWFIYNEKALSETIDLVEGMPVFLPEQVLPDETSPGISLPGGSSVLDGEKTVQYLAYVCKEDSYAEMVSRRQKFFSSFLARIAKNPQVSSSGQMADLLAGKPSSNFGMAVRKELMKRFSTIDADTIMAQYISGSLKSFEGRILLFPHFDGELARDVIQQTVKALAVSEAQLATKAAVTVEILNGSGVKGIGTKAAELYESFGYRVVSVGNAPRFDFEQTVLYDNDGDKTVAQQAAEIIRCRQFGDPSDLSVARNADITIVIGKDFNGRYCIGK